jgi:hypothetical protein
MIHALPAVTAAEEPVVAAAAALVLAACSSTPQSPEGAAEVRSKLTRLQSDPNLGTRAPLALQEAETAVRVAEQPVANDAALGAHRVYMADRKVEIAIAQANTRFSEDQRAKLADERDRERLDARTREADKAKADADAVELASDAARLAVPTPTRHAPRRRFSKPAAQQADELQRQIDAAGQSDRARPGADAGTCCSPVRADLKVGAASNLDRLVAFNQYPNRNVEIEVTPMSAATTSTRACNAAPIP